MYYSFKLPLEHYWLLSEDLQCCLSVNHLWQVPTSESLPPQLAGLVLKVCSLCICQCGAPGQCGAVTEDHFKCSLHVPHLWASRRLEGEEANMSCGIFKQHVFRAQFKFSMTANSKITEVCIRPLLLLAICAMKCCVISV